MADGSILDASDDSVFFQQSPSYKNILCLLSFDWFLRKLLSGGETLLFIFCVSQRLLFLPLLFPELPVGVRMTGGSICVGLLGHFQRTTQVNKIASKAAADIRIRP